MTRSEINYAFSMVRLNYVIVLVASVMLFNEFFGPTKVVGTLLAIVGVAVIFQGRKT